MISGSGGNVDHLAQNFSFLMDSKIASHAAIVALSPAALVTQSVYFLDHRILFFPINHIQANRIPSAKVGRYKEHRLLERHGTLKMRWFYRETPLLVQIDCI